jgi:hypothetical protein
LTVCPGGPGTLGTSLFAQQVTPRKLNITIIEGEGAINNIKSRVARETIVEVTDENRKPVAGAIVTFTMPNSGPGGTFLDGNQIMTVTTDQNGRATARNLRPNSNTGSYQIRVTATFAGLSATAAIAQTNVAAAGGLLGMGVPATIGVVGAIAAVAAVVITRTVGGDDDTAAPGRSARISVGQPTLP